MKTIRCFLLLLAGSLACASLAQTKPTLTPDQKSYLGTYESLRAGLAADDLSAAKKAAVEILKAAPKAGDKPEANFLAAQKIANATDLAGAREAFKALSKHAVALAAGQSGYFHAHCPMVPNDEGDWVQTSKRINNPYFGKSMLTCGSIE